jgi:hypothetical protein
VVSSGDQPRGNAAKRICNAVSVPSISRLPVANAPAIASWPATTPATVPESPMTAPSAPPGARPRVTAGLVEFVVKAPGPGERDRGGIRALHSVRYA